MRALGDREVRPQLIGFFSYSRDDDDRMRGALSRLRTRIRNHLGTLNGRADKDFLLWQDKKAIDPGDQWEHKIRAAISSAVFFIPIITPSAIASKYCRIEFEAFLEREQNLGRGDLIFPILFVDVPGLEPEEEYLRKGNLALSIVFAREYVKWQKFNLSGVRSVAFEKAIWQFCETITKKLREPAWTEEEAEAARLADERRKAEEAKAARLAEERRRAEEVEAARLAGERRKAEEAEAARLAEERRRAEEAEAARLADERRKAEEAEAVRLAEERRRIVRRLQQRAEEEAARLAEEQRRAEEAEVARLADEKRQAQETMIAAACQAGVLALKQRNFVAARTAYDRAFLLSKSHRNTQGIATSLVGLGDVAMAAGDFKGAWLAYDQASLQFDQISDLTNKATSTRKSKRAHQSEDRRRAAEAARLADERRKAEEAEAARLAEERRAAEAARLAEERRRAEEAEAARLVEDKRKGDEAARRAQERRKPLSVPLAMALSMGDRALEERAIEAAREAYSRSLSLSVQQAHILGQARSLIGLGRVAMATSSFKSARESFGRAMSLFSQVEDQQGIRIATRAQAKLQNVADEIKVKATKSFSRLQSALIERERVLGVEHPDTLEIIDQLAQCLMNLEDAEAALPLYRRALETRQRLLGPEHPDTFNSANRLAECLEWMGDRPGAANVLAEIRRAAEEARVVRKQRQAEEAARQAEERRKAEEAEAARLAEERRKAEEAEAARLAEERRRAEEAEAARQAEERRNAAEAEAVQQAKERRRAEEAAAARQAEERRNAAEAEAARQAEERRKIEAALRADPVGWARQLLAANDVASAVSVLARALPSPQIEYLQAVCALRANDPQTAVRILLPMLLPNGARYPADRTPDQWIVTYATAVALAGDPGGASRALEWVRDQRNLGAVRR